MPGALHVRHVRAGEGGRLREVRLAALAADPDAFATSHARDAARPAAWWTRSAADSEAGTERRTFVLTDADDRWLGLALARRDDEDPQTAVLNAMWVAPEARGRGGAVALCDACAAWAAERRHRNLRLNVVAGNAPAIAAYEAAGFSVRRRTTWRDGDRVLDELVMTRPLGPSAGPRLMA